MSEIFLLYGIPVNEIKNFIQERGVKATVTSSDNGVKVLFDYSGLEENAVYEFLGEFSKKYKSNIYAETDITLANQLVKIAKLRGLKIKTAESFTSGRVASEITSISGASEVFYEGIIAYSNSSKMERLGVQSETLKKHYAVSSQVAFEMCKGLLHNADNTLAIATTGIAGPNSDESEKPVGLCYIAVGSKTKIVVYKHNFKGDREQITNQGKYAALFHAVSALRSSDFDI